MKVNIARKFLVQWEASTRPNSKKSIAENVVSFVDKSLIGVQYHQENKLKPSINWMAEWSGAPPHPPREAHSVSSSNLTMGECFFHFLN